MSRADIARAMRGRDSAALADFPTVAVAEHLVQLAAEQAAVWPPSDLDSLMSAGAVTLAAGHRDADAALLEWLYEAPSASRLRMVSTILGVMWTPAWRQPVPPVGSDRIRSLLTAGRRVPWDPLVHPPYLAALAGAALTSRDPEVRHAVLVELRAAAGRDAVLASAFRTQIRELAEKPAGG